MIPISLYIRPQCTKQKELPENCLSSRLRDESSNHDEEFFPFITSKKFRTYTFLLYNTTLDQYFICSCISVHPSSGIYPSTCVSTIQFCPSSKYITAKNNKCNFPSSLHDMTPEEIARQF
jgi:hypothetical protein